MNNFKKCFTCKRNKPLFLFNKNNRKYKIPSDKGRNIECRSCKVKRLIKNKGEHLYWDRYNNLFVTEKIKLNIINIIKHYFK